jgi:hypothetical protein
MTGWIGCPATAGADVLDDVGCIFDNGSFAIRTPKYLQGRVLFSFVSAELAYFFFSFSVTILAPHRAAILSA